jgi:GTP-binding protein
VFVDEAEIDVESGHGGAGAVSFRRETFVPKGGPDGGDGGRGGDVVLVSDANVSTLLEFRHARRFKASNGEPGHGSRSSGKSGGDVLVRVPVGTIVEDLETGEVVGDFVRAGEQMTVAPGGRGGKGNFHFRSSTNRAPRYAQPGEGAVKRRLRLTLKLIADVGLVGLPNAGKSTLLARISRARPKIADYPFTTLAPMLGIVSLGDFRTMVVADIPGIIEGAHEGRGLGLRFLRHIERTRVLAFLVDAGAADPGADYGTLLSELGLFSESLLKKPRVVVYSKADTVPAAEVPALPNTDVEPLLISSVTGQGIAELLERLAKLVVRERDAGLAALNEDSREPTNG